MLEQVLDSTPPDRGVYRNSTSFVQSDEGNRCSVGIGWSRTDLRPSPVVLLECEQLIGGDPQPIFFGSCPFEAEEEKRKILGRLRLSFLKPLARSSHHELSLGP